MNTTILDCYTDEPSGLGVPPYLGTYPRYLAGYYGNPTYLTVDDLRLWRKYDSSIPKTRPSQKTDIGVYNLTKNYRRVKEILDNTDQLVIIAGVHTPGKYLSASPATLQEISRLVDGLKCRKILTGPAIYGTSVQGGQFYERIDMSIFDDVKDFKFTYEDIKEYAVRGAAILEQIPDLRMLELETSKGCSRKIGCSFCTEPIKSKFILRKKEDILEEAKALYKRGAVHFRLGKQSSYPAHPDAIDILKDIRKACPKLQTLHIDNVEPAHILGKRGEKITKAIVQYCTPGNVAALGAETFDPAVYESNTLNATAEETYEAVRILNKYGAERGSNGMPKYLAGINILFGLKDETKETNEHNMEWLTRMVKENLLVRRINVRQVNIFEGTPLFMTAGNKFLKKNKKYYWKWRDDIRQKIDVPMLQKIAPDGQVFRNIWTEIYDGKTTFGRQLGTYPLIVGIKQRLPLKRYIDVKVTGRMKRSIVAEPAKVL